MNGSDIVFIIFVIACIVALYNISRAEKLEKKISNLHFEYNNEIIDLHNQITDLEIDLKRATTACEHLTERLNVKKKETSIEEINERLIAVTNPEFDLKEFDDRSLGNFATAHQLNIENLQAFIDSCYGADPKEVEELIRNIVLEVSEDRTMNDIAETQTKEVNLPTLKG